MAALYVNMDDSARYSKIDLKLVNEDVSLVTFACIDILRAWSDRVNKEKKKYIYIFLEPEIAVRS